MLLVALGILAQRAAEAARQHLAHHGKIVARRALGLDVELTVGVLDETVRPRHHHGADRRAALDVAVVVDLDALGRTVKAKYPRHALEQLALGAAFGHATRQRLAGVDHGLVEGVLLVATPGMADLDLVARRHGERAFEKVAFGDVVACQDQLGRLARFVELAPNRHLAGLAKRINRRLPIESLATIEGLQSKDKTPTSAA